MPVARKSGISRCRPMSPKVRSAETAGDTCCSSREVVAAREPARGAEEDAVGAGVEVGRPARCRGEAEVVMRSLVAGVEAGGVLPRSRSCIIQLYAGGTLVPHGPHGPHEEERP